MFRARPPIPEDARRWVEEGMAFFAAEFGTEALHGPVAVPDMSRLPDGFAPGPDEDVDAAVRWWRVGAEAGSIDFADSLTRRDLDQGRAADAGEIYERLHAQNGVRKVEVRAAFGLGVVRAAQNLRSDAESWWRHAAEAGDAVAAVELARLLCDERPEDSEQWRRSAAAANGAPCLALGLMYHEQGRDARALECLSWVRDRSDFGGTMDVVHRLWPAGRLDDAAAWLDAVAEDAGTAVMRLLCTLLRYADRPEEGVQWLTRAAEAGDAEAMGELGALFESERRLGPAAHWYRKAVEAGHPGAEGALARLPRRSGGRRSGE